MRGPLVFAVVLLLVAPTNHAAAVTGPMAQPIPTLTLQGRIVDFSGAAIIGAQVTATPDTGAASVPAVTDARGAYEVSLAPGAYTVTASAPGFAEALQRVPASARGTTTADFTLQVAAISESVRVGAVAGYGVAAVASATKTATPLRDIPQAVSIVSRTLIADQRMTSMGDVIRYMPGVGMAQGEGNRDTPVLRGNSTTADFFVDGVRDDVQYFRDVYNVERVEALKGPSAMTFGRGGGGGVINRVTRQADWGQAREASLQLGSWGNRRATADVGRGLTQRLALRATGLYENSGSFREGVNLQRYGINPTLAVRLGAATTLRAGYERFSDERTADRGISSFSGRPLKTSAATFFGDPTQSRSNATVNVFSALVERRLNSQITFTNRISYGDYDKFYQNVFPGAVDTSATSVAISAYNNATTRTNVFNQADLIVATTTGRLGHTMLFGAEMGRQRTDNFRNTGYFTALGPNATSFSAAVAAPTISTPVAYRQSATDANNHGVATVLGLYAQDQIALSGRLKAVVGLRLDRFNVDFTNNRTAGQFSSHDDLISPRAGVIYQPTAPLSIYGGYSMTHLPRAGDQLSSLSLTNQALEPEQFRNYEAGAKWDVRPSLALTMAVYRLNRANIAIADPNDPTRSILVNGQRAEGLEVEFTGNITRAWQVAGGYAYQDGKITESLSATAHAGAVLALVPKHSMSLWNKYDITRRLGAGVGVLYRGQVFTSTDNLVALPRWTRVDGAVFYEVTSRLRAQVNVENVFDEGYYVSAHSNTNITPGSPRAVRLALTTRF